MKTEMHGDDHDGGDADSGLERRLGERFDGELARAEQDYPATAAALRLREGIGAARSRWSRLAAPAAGLAVLGAFALVAAGLVLGPMAAPGPAGSGKGPFSPGPSSECGAAGPVVPGVVPSAACSTVPPAGPTSGPSIVAGKDGIPASIGGKTVYRFGTLPSMKLGSSLLVGGIVARDTSCAAPTPWTVMYPPSCGYWTVDGIKLGAVPGVFDESMIGKSVVVNVTMSRVISQCFGPCPPTPFLYATKVVWENGAVLP